MTRKTGKKPNPPALSPTLHMSSADARLAFDHLDTSWGLMPDHRARDEFEIAWDRLTTVARAHGITDLYGLLKDLALVLRAIAVPTSAIEDTTDEVALASIHLHRNVAVAIGAAAAASIGAEPSAVYALPANVKIAARTADPRKQGRPAEIDEVVLLRTYTALGATNTSGRTRRAAATVAMTDAGCMLRETTQITDDSLLDVVEGMASAVLANGHNNGVESRFITLDDFHARVLQTVLLDARPGRPLLYEARKPNADTYAGGSSADGVLKRALTAVGLGHTDIEASALRRWRIKTTWHTHGPDAAAAIAGTDVARAARLADIQTTRDLVIDLPAATSGFQPLPLAA
ncbi:hypothetical protein [Cellulomonas septica]|uniref:DUF222 domain-containing protein n=1 Tax=Cellulomonas septica TaxID=285080 RepID=A0ABX1JWN0_9CELL|nr:hypothetical protein [Cellulomonas septica]NKY38152.1 hypothetical protein [Cellulomonas septica]